MAAAKQCDHCRAYHGADAEWLTVEHAGRYDSLGQPKLSGDYCSAECLRAKTDELAAWNTKHAEDARAYNEKWNAQISAASSGFRDDIARMCMPRRPRVPDDHSSVT